MSLFRQFVFPPFDYQYNGQELTTQSFVLRWKVCPDCHVSSSSSSARGSDFTIISFTTTIRSKLNCLSTGQNMGMDAVSMAVFISMTESKTVVGGYHVGSGGIVSKPRWLRCMASTRRPLRRTTLITMALMSELILDP